MPVKVCAQACRKSAAPRRSPATAPHPDHPCRQFGPRRACENSGPTRRTAVHEPAFETCLHDSVAEVVRKQRDRPRIVNDGEYARPSLSRYVLRRLSGFEQRGQSEAGSGGGRRARPPRIRGILRRL